MRISALSGHILGQGRKLFRGIFALPRHPRAAGAVFLAVVLITGVIASSLLLFQEPVGAATYTFVQNNWTGGFDSGTRPVHPTNQTGWNKWDSKTANMDTSQANLALLGLTISQFSQTSDTDFNAGTKTNTVVTGTGSAGSVQLAPGNDVYSVLSPATNMSLGGTIARGSGNPVISYIATDNTVKLALCNNATCSSATQRTIATFNPASSNYIYDAAVAVNGSGNPVVGYGTYQLGVRSTWWFYVYTCNDATCSSGTNNQVDTGSGVFYSGVAAATDSGGIPAFAYGPGGSSAPTMMTRCMTVGCTSFLTPVQVSSSFGQNNPSIVWGSDGKPVIVTTSEVIHCADVNCSSKTAVALDNTHSAIAVGSGGIPTIAVDSSVVRCTTASCTALTAPVTISGATTPDIIMSNSGLPVISYRDAGGNLAVTYCGNATCSSIDHSTTIGPSSYDSANLEMRGPTMVLGSDSVPLVAYRNGSILQVADATLGYQSSGTFTSSILDTQGPAGGGWGTMTWNNNANPTLSLKVRTSNSATMSGAPAFSTCTAITKGADISSNNCVNDTHRYIQYEATFSTSVSTQTPQLNDLTIQFLPYTTTPQDLLSSWYDTRSTQNILQDIVWSETLQANTDVKFQIRTAPDAGGQPGTPTAWCGPDDGTPGTCNSATFFTDPSGISENVDDILRDGTNDEWVQYKVTMQSVDGNSSPTLTSVTLTYVVNAPPEFNPNYPATGNGGVSASQNADGSVTISYSVRDPDTTSGQYTQGFVTPTYQYSLNNGTTWSTISSVNMSANATAQKAVQEVSYLPYTVTWFPKQHLNGTYADQTTKVRVIVSDSELANATAQADSAPFTLDVKNPASVTVTLNAATDQVMLAATDDTALTMNISDSLGNFPQENEQAFSSPVSKTMTQNQTVYVRITDAFSNKTTAQATTPATPADIIVRDTSNASTSAWQEFVSWGVVSAPQAGFGAYELYRSIDGGAYSLRTTITDRLTNFYVDQGLTTGSTYAYKVLTKDTPGNRSDYSAVVQDIPDGQGGTDITAPVISSVAVTDIDTTHATITWNTSELADSKVNYSTVCAQNPIPITSPSFVISHSVTLTSLQPGTVYLFSVTATDIAGNIGGSDNGGNCYSFNTLPGAIISGVGVSNIGGNTATVNWQTNIPADSSVIYSTATDLSGSQQTGTPQLITAHTVVLSGLTPATRYYFDVLSTDGLRNPARATNAGNHYFFDTINDTIPPQITNVRTDSVDLTSAVIAWDTDEKATSGVDYGLDSSYGSTGPANAELVFGHSVVLTGLTAGTTYHFRVRSADSSNNTALSGDYTFITIQEKKAGGTTPELKDLTPPIISQLAVTVVSATEAKASWKTDEPANTILHYGPSTKYGLEGAGAFDVYTKDHAVDLIDLKPDTEYHAQVIAFDQAGNSATSKDVTFKTPKSGEEPKTEEQQKKEQQQKEEQPKSEAQKPPEVQQKTEQKGIDQLSSPSGFSVDQLLQVLREQFPGRTFTPEEFQDVVSKIGQPPLIAGDFPKVEITANEATITWLTDRPANSLVAYTREDRFRPGEPYPLEVGNSGELVAIHVVKLTGLSPATTYVFEVRSRGPIGGLATKGPFRFTTLSPILAINNVDFVAPNQNSLKFTWTTSFPALATLSVMNANTGQIVTLRDDKLLLEHGFTLENLDPASEYRATITATDALGNTANFPDFVVSTSLDTRPPQITQVQTQSALIQSSFGDRVQTIISWHTNEQATSQVYYQQGAGTIAGNDPKGYSFSTEPQSDLTTEHTVVIAAFQPNTVYQYIVVSQDRSGNQAVSDPFAILTPQRKESVLQLILRNFEQLFRFLPGVGG